LEGFDLLIRRLQERQEITALDNTKVREILNPLHDEEDLRLGYSLAQAVLEPGQSSLPHRFKEASEVYCITKGRGIMHIDEQFSEVGPGDTIYIPPMAIQWIENAGSERLEFLCIVDPSWKPDAEELVED
jgi:mannose-6-phosphate isomerase-like protein (cupin superfamily)